MKRLFATICLICLSSSMYSTAFAGRHFKTEQYAVLLALDTNTRTMTVAGDVYKLRVGVRIHDPVTKLPGLSSLIVGGDIKFKTRINKKTGQVEVTDIWVLHQ